MAGPVDTAQRAADAYAAMQATFYQRSSKLYHENSPYDPVRDPRHGYLWSFEEAALDLGETPVSAFRLITLPLVMPGMISSFLISFTISIDEYIIANFLGGNDTVLSVYIYGQFRFPAKVPMVLALGTCLVAASILLLTIAEYFRRRGIAKAGGKDSGGFL